MDYRLVFHGHVFHCFQYQGTFDAVDCIRFRHGLDEYKSSHPSNIPNSGHRHRLHWVKHTYPRPNHSAQMVLCQKLTAFAWNVYDGRQEIDVSSSSSMSLTYSHWCHGKKNEQFSLHRLSSITSATYSSSQASWSVHPLTLQNTNDGSH